MVFGSYLPAHVSIGRSAIMIVCADTLIALLAGLVIFPLVFENNLSPESGTGLIFNTLPLAFEQIPLGRWVALIFFLLLSMAAITSMVGFEYITINNLYIITSYKRIQGNESEQKDILNASFNFRSKRETEYAMSIDGNEDLKAGFDISKNVNGFDLKFNANQSFNKNSNQAAEISLSRKF